MAGGYTNLDKVRPGGYRRVTQETVNPSPPPENFHHTDDSDEDDAPPSYQRGGGPNFYLGPRTGVRPPVQAMSPAKVADQTLHPDMSTVPGPNIGCDENPGDVMIHLVPENSKSRWSHIEDLDSFFKNVYSYHQGHGFRVMMLHKFSELFQVLFIVLLTVYLFQCVRYDVLFNNQPKELKVGATGEKVTLADVTIPLGECSAGFGFYTFGFLLVSISFWLMKFLAVTYQVFQYWDIKLFYNHALHIADDELGSLTWYDVQKRLLEAQADHLMCIHKQQLSGLDIYHRILRWKNYNVALVNKDLLPLRITIPGAGDTVFFSQGLKYNIEWLLFKGPWAPFDKWHLKEDYKRINKRKDLIENLQSRISMLAVLNFLLMPLILLWQLLYCFYNYAEMIKREPGSLGVRKWSEYGKLYLRHFNELDHELKGRLNRAYRPANQYMEIFVSPLSAVFARFITFPAGSVLAVMIVLSVWDEDVLNVEHVLTIITVLGAVVAAARVFIPDENLVFCPEKTLTTVIAHIHYFPDSWKGQAHTSKVMTELGELFPYTAVYLLHELISPVVTPFILFYSLRAKAPQIVDFFRNFTVDVVGVGDVCSFAQMDVRRHGNPDWQAVAVGGGQDTAKVEPEAPKPKTNPYSRAESGKTEMSLIHFTLTNPEWKPPAESENFIAALQGHVVREAEALPTVLETEGSASLEDNALFASLNAVRNNGGIQNDYISGCFSGGAIGPVPSHGILSSVHQGFCNGRSSIFAASHLPPTNGSMFMMGGYGMSTTHLLPPPNLRQDLRRLGLEYTTTDMSVSALYLHEMHHRMTSFRRNATPSMAEPPRRASLSELDEENLPLVEQDNCANNRLTSSTMA